MSFGEKLLALDSNNPLELANKYRYQAEHNYRPRSALEAKQKNLVQFERADSLSERVLLVWRQHKEEAVRYNDIKKAKHERRHRWAWQMQSKAMRGSDKIRSKLKTSSNIALRRARTWPLQGEQWVLALDRAASHIASDTGLTEALVAAQWSKNTMHWDALNQEQCALSRQIHQMLQGQLDTTVAIHHINAVLCGLHLRHTQCRLQGWDDLDWPIDKLDSMLGVQLLLRDTLMRGLSPLEWSSRLKTLQSKQKAVQRAMAGTMQVQKQLAKKWKATSTSGGEFERAKRAFMDTTAIAIVQWKNDQLEHAALAQRLADDYTAIRRGIKKERRCHQRDHHVELQAGIARAKWLDRRYHEVYHQLKDSDKKVDQRKRRLQLDIEREVALRKG